jgi:hypothetical protein
LKGGIKLTSEQIKDIVIALIEKGYVNTSSLDAVINSVVKAINTISEKCN